MSVTWSDRALARTLGTDDPEMLNLAKFVLDADDSPVCLTYAEPSVYDDPLEPAMELVDVPDAVADILSRYDSRGQRRTT